MPDRSWAEYWNDVRRDIAETKAKEKRFTDAELAAEYWKANNGTQIRAYRRDEDGNIIDIRGVGWERESDVMLRFATRPHYNETAKDNT